VGSDAPANNNTEHQNLKISFVVHLNSVLDTARYIGLGTTHSYRDPPIGVCLSVYSQPLSGQF